MARCFNYSVVQFSAHPLRNERLNLAVAVFNDNGLDVRPSRRLDKLRVISAALNLDEVGEALARLVHMDSLANAARNRTPDQRRLELVATSPFRLSSLGEFVAPDRDAYERQLSLLLERFVEPEPAPASISPKKQTGLLKSIKVALRAENILAKKGEGLDAHRVISNHEIAEGLKADLLLKNGAMHIVETVDASADDGSLRRAISGVAISALVFEQARMHFGNKQTKAQLVYTASASLERAIAPSLQAAEHQGALLVNWESADDRRALITYLARLAVPLEKKTRGGNSAIDASVQHKFRLN